MAEAEELQQTRVQVQSACPTCGAANADMGRPSASSYVYAIGRIEARFPRLSIEKELAQVMGRTDTRGLTDTDALQKVLQHPENRYLVRQLCWVMRVQTIEAYILVPGDPGDYGRLVETLRQAPSPMDLDVVIGVRGPMAPPDTCNGLILPIVAFDQIYSFDRESLIKAIPRPEKAGAKEFMAAAGELLDRVMQMADNAGTEDAQRALNYLVVRYPAIYATAADAFGRNCSLTAVDTRPSPLSGARNILDVIFSFTNRNTDVVEKFFTRVDVTDEFPFLVTKMSPYYDR
jgi:hypothetical protein